MSYAYILQTVSSPDHLYHGHSSDLKQRLSDHNGGHCPHTAKFRPWKLKFYAAFESPERAPRFEHYLKSGSWSRICSASPALNRARVLGSGELLAIHANLTASYRLRLPAAASVTGIFTARVFAPDSTELTLSLNRADTADALFVSPQIRCGKWLVRSTITMRWPVSYFGWEVGRGLILVGLIISAFNLQLDSRPVGLAKE